MSALVVMTFLEHAVGHAVDREQLTAWDSVFATGYGRVQNAACMSSCFNSSLHT